MSSFFSVILTVLLLAIAAFFAYVIIRYVPLIERIAFDVPRHQAPQRFSHPSDFRTEDIHIPVSHLHFLNAEYVHSQKAKKGIVIFCHETGADGDSWQKHIAFLPKAGWDVLTFHFDQGSYQWPSMEERRCIDAVMNWVRQHRAGSTVVVFGVSKGSALAASVGGYPQVKALVLDGLFSTQLTLTHYMSKWVTLYIWKAGAAPYIPRGLYSSLAFLVIGYASLKNRRRFMTVEPYLSRIRVPSLLIHAERDSFVRLSDIHALRQRFVSKTDLWVAQGARHSDSVVRYPQAYEKRVLAFLDSL